MDIYDLQVNSNRKGGGGEGVQQSNSQTQANQPPLWSDLNDIRWQIYTSSSQNTKNTLSVSIVGPKLKDNCPRALQKALLKLLQCHAKLPLQERFLWLSSFYLQRAYPPISLEETGGYTPHFLIEETGVSLDSKDFPEYKINKPLLSSSAPKTGTPNLIRQHRKIGDCSFVCSLINLQRANELLPYLASKNVPGTYMVNFHFNGSDDRLVCTTNVAHIPTTDSDDQLGLYSSEKNHKILELAYLKLKGSSYNHIGSNTAIDTFLLAGFIPETLKIRDLASWAKLLQFYKSGLCTVAFGTKAVFANVSCEFISGHDYAVHDFSGSQISLTNPWAPEVPIVIKQWSTFTEYFDVAYISWNAKKMFKFHEKIHFSYNAETNNKSIRSTLNKPAFLIANDSLNNETVYVLLEKHLSQEHPGIHLELVNDSIDVSNLTKYKNNTGFHLLKVSIDSITQKRVCCFSELSVRFTLHIYSLSKSITIKKADDKNVISVTNVFLENYTFENDKYCMNQTYKLDFADANDENKHCNNDGSENVVLCTVQLLATKSHINFQLYHLNDFALERPLISEHAYEFEMQTSPQIPLARNKQYKLICSAKDAYCGAGFVLGCSTNKRSIRPKLSEYYNYFGGLFKTSFSATDFVVEDIGDGTKLSVLLKSEMGSCHDMWNIRLFNVSCKKKHFDWSIRVVDQEYGHSLLSNSSGCSTFTSNTAANVVVNKNGAVSRKVTFEMTLLEKIDPRSTHLLMEIGTQYKLSK
ncbi:hypothetical protein ACO0RG_001295 [Hanseniaspora osmophila]